MAEECTLTRRRLLGGVAGIGAAGLAGCAAVAPPGTDTGTSAEREGGFVDLYEAMSPAVVEVRVGGTPAGPSARGGSGFLMRDVGIVTNSHVIVDAEQVEIRFQDRTWTEASVVGRDVHSDLAVIDDGPVPDAVPALAFEETVPPIGTEVMAIGAPYGFGGSASTGIVSGTNRILPSPSGFGIPAAIQTDAAVNPGNSGGPLVDLAGDVIGVVFAGATENIGFAISGPLASRVLPVLAAGESYEHSYVGIRMLDVGPGIAEENDLPDASGVYINEVVPGSPADGILHGTDESVRRDGQRVPVGGDVIMAVDGTEVEDVDAFQTYMALETAPDETVTYRLRRDGATTDVSLTLGTRPERPTSG